MRERVRSTPESRHSWRDFPTVIFGGPLSPQERTFISRFRVGGYHHLSNNFSVQKVQPNSRGSLSASRIPGKISLSGPRSLTRGLLQFLEPFEHAELRTQCCQGAGIILDRGDVDTVMTHTSPMCRTHTRLKSFTAFGTNQAARNNLQAKSKRCSRGGKMCGCPVC